MKLLLTLLIFTGVCHAQLPKNRDVAPQFLSWNTAWEKSGSSTRERLAWVPKARQGNWTASDKPFLLARKEVEQTWRELDDMDKTVELYKTRALQLRTAKADFAWGYAEWLRYQYTGDIRQTYWSQIAMSRTYTPSFQYVRLLFLLPSQPEHLKTLEPIAQLLLRRDSKDRWVKEKVVEVLRGLPTLAARQQAEKLHKELIAAYPNSYQWSKFGHLYAQWWRWNDWSSENAESAVDRQLAKSLAIRDAKLTIAAWNKSIALSPNPQWKDVKGPEMVQLVETWLQKNS